MAGWIQLKSFLSNQQYQSKQMAQANLSAAVPLSPSSFFLRKVTAPPSACIQMEFGSPSSPWESVQRAAMPTFNRDRRHFTPSFILSGDQERYGEHWETYLGIHLRKTTEMQQQKSILLVPKPSRNNSYCCVCRTPFEDYLTHLSTPSHTLLMHNSEYHLRIEQLCSTFSHKQHSAAPLTKKRGRPCKAGKKTKPISKLPVLASKRSLSTDESNKVEQEGVSVIV